MAVSADFAAPGRWLQDYMAVVQIVVLVAFVLVELTFGAGRTSTSSKRVTTNFALGLLAAMAMFVLPAGTVAVAIAAQTVGVGLFNHVAAPAWVVVAVALLSRTALGYALHRASHAIPLLWRLHRVHHSDAHVDLSLSFRHHPLEIVPALIVFGSGAALLGLPPWAVAMIELAMVVADYNDHLDVVLPARMRRAIGWVLITPDAHRLHHSADRIETDSNFGSLLSLWDRLGGTWRAPVAPVQRIGLGDADDAVGDDLRALLIQPFRRPLS